MAELPYLQLVDVKRWADRGLCGAIRENADRLGAEDMAILIQILDHFHAVDRIFQHHLLGRAHDFRAARSEVPPAFDELAQSIGETDEWYRAYVAGLTPPEFDEHVDFTFTSGKPARMRRGEILLHIALHGSYHRGNAGAVLQLKGLSPSPDAITHYLEDRARA
jgi:uncharacterized damage-inducible protein DinB